MKALRIWMLVLLAVLLPVRGALAAAMLCPMMAPAGSSTPALDHAAMGHAMPAEADAGDTGDMPQTGASDSCNLCCDFCSAVPLASSVPALPSAQEHSTLSFPDPDATVPRFVSDGQERPPRST